jgi:hypothetical protein
MRNFPVVTVQAYEGTLTRYTTGFNEVGGQQDVAVYSAPLVKGDLVQLYGHTQLDQIQVQKFPVGNEVDEVHGMCVSSPWGVDNTTVSGQTPTHAYQRLVDVAFFGLGVIELVSSGTVRPGYGVGLSESTANTVTEYSALESVGSGRWVSMSYATVGLPVKILIGWSGYVPVD